MPELLDKSFSFTSIVCTVLQMLKEDPVLRQTAMKGLLRISLTENQAVTRKMGFQDESSLTLAQNL